MEAACYMAWLLLAGLSSADALGVTSARQQRRLSPSINDNNFINAALDFDDVNLHESEVFLKTPDFVKKYGYPIETHTVTTEDGYLLTLHRIPGSPKASSAGVGTPVLVQHGASAASDQWVLAGPERGLGFLLADQGYDVWLGNARGNFYSRSHVTISNRDYEFHNYTWHEMGVYDLPAVVDYILATTNHKQLFYICHSMGCTMFFVLNSVRPEYNQKFRLMVCLAPAVFLLNLRSIVGAMLPVANQIFKSFNDVRESHIGSREIPIMRLVNSLCRDGQPFQNLCISSYFSVIGFNWKELNTTMMPTYLAHLLSGVSVNMLYHYTQVANADSFQRFHRSSRMYSKQPEYELHKVTVPVTIHYGLNDALVSPAGVFRLSQRLPNLVKLIQIPDKRANHMDIAFSIHVRELVYDEMIAYMRDF